MPSPNMPHINQSAIASAGVIAVSIAVAAAIAVYESPELRRMAEDLRRRIAIALHSLGDGVSPQTRDPMFNRPEDAEGFLRSRGTTAAPADHGVDADDETRRRQREELMYWNAVLAEKKEKERLVAEEKSGAATDRPAVPRKGSSFDDFLQEDKTAEKGTYVFNTGVDVGGHSEGLIRRRVPDGDRGLSASSLSNPFADEHMIGTDEMPHMTANILNPGRDEGLSDIYNATEHGLGSPTPIAVAAAAQGDILFDWAAEPEPEPEAATAADPLLERELGADEYMTAGQEDHQHDAFASIQAWAQQSNTGFYSPLPVSPAAPLSEPEIISQGALTPTDSASQAGSGEDIGDDANSSRTGEGVRYYDVLSDEEDGPATPASWTEVGSVMSESEAGAVHA